MKIDTGEISQLLSNYDKKSQSQKTDKQGNELKDKLAVSDEALQVQKGRQAYEQLPDVREDKVAELKQQVRSGNYDVSGEEVAEKMIEEAIIDKKV